MDQQNNIYSGDTIYKQNVLNRFAKNAIEDSFQSYVFLKARFVIIIFMLVTVTIEIIDFTYMSKLSTYYQESAMGYYFLGNMFLWLWAIWYIATRESNRFLTRIVIFLPSFYFYVTMLNKEDLQSSLLIIIIHNHVFNQFIWSRWCHLIVLNQATFGSIWVIVKGLIYFGFFSSTKYNNIQEKVASSQMFLISLLINSVICVLWSFFEQYTRENWVYCSTFEKSAQFFQFIIQKCKTSMIITDQNLNIVFYNDYFQTVLKQACSIEMRQKLRLNFTKVLDG